MKLSALDDLLWALSSLWTVGLVALLFWRPRWKQFPLFTSLQSHLAARGLTRTEPTRTCAWIGPLAALAWIAMDFFLPSGREDLRQAMPRAGNDAGSTDRTGLQSTIWSRLSVLRSQYSRTTVLSRHTCRTLSGWPSDHEARA